MRKNKKQKNDSLVPIDFMYNLPVIEFSGNRRVTVEGSTGVLQYESQVVRINTNSMVLVFSGRELILKCISPTCVIIEGYITETEFIT